MPMVDVYNKNGGVDVAVKTSKRAKKQQQRINSKYQLDSHRLTANVDSRLPNRDVRSARTTPGSVTVEGEGQVTNREMLAFQGVLQSAENTITVGEVNSILQANDTKIYDKVKALHKSYTVKEQKIVNVKRQLVERYAVKDKDGHAIVRAQEIDGEIITDYDYGPDRKLVESALDNWVVPNTQRRAVINALWEEETDVAWNLVDEKDIPEELKEDLLPITRPKEAEIISR